MSDKLVEAVARAASMVRRDSDEYSQHDEDIARAALAAIEAEGYAVMPGWRPIATAPKDGTPFLGAIPSDLYPSGWEVLRMEWDSRGVFCDATYAPFAEDQDQPILWMPVPVPPAKEQT